MILAARPGPSSETKPAVKTFLTVIASSRAPDPQLIRCTVGDIVAFHRRTRELAEPPVTIDLITAIDVAIRDLTEIAGTNDLALARHRAAECLATLASAFNSATG